MVSIDHIDDKSQTFRAVFYIEITAKQKIDISDIKFSNAARSEADHAPLVEKQVLSEEKNKDNYHLLAKVSGKFYFRLIIAYTLLTIKILTSLFRQPIR